MEEYLHKALEERYLELCEIKDRIASEKEEVQREGLKRRFLEKSDEIQEILREQRVKEAKIRLMRERFR